MCVSSLRGSKASRFRLINCAYGCYSIVTSLSYVISAGNTTPGNFVSQIYLYDLSGRGNLTTSYTVNVSDDTFPTIHNITYSPNTPDGLVLS